MAGNIDVVFKPALLASGAGIIGKNAWVRAGDSGSVFWLSSGREFMVWTGGATPTTITCPVKNLFFRQVIRRSRKFDFCRVRPKKTR